MRMTHLTRRSRTVSVMQGLLSLATDRAQQRPLAARQGDGCAGAWMPAATLPPATDAPARAEGATADLRSYAKVSSALSQGGVLTQFSGGEIILRAPFA